MIIRVFNRKDELLQCQSFKEYTLTIGRNPSTKPSLILDSQTVSRNHLKVSIKKNKIKLQDLNSSNGTFVNAQQIEPMSLVRVHKSDRIKAAEFEGYIKISRIKDEDLNSSGQESEREEVQQKNEYFKRSKPAGQFKIQLAESTLKMLRSMTADKKSKAEKIKFLKLMGVGSAEQNWEQIEQQINSKKSYFLCNANKKTSNDLQKQFSQSRSTHQKRGLGK